MPLLPYPDDLSVEHQGVEIPGSKKDGQSGVWKSGTFDMSLLTGPDKPQTLFEMFEQAVARRPERNLFLRRAVLPAIPSATGDIPAPAFGTSVIGTTYATVQQRRNDIGSALLGLERAGRLRSDKVAASTVTPPEITHPGVPHYGNANRVKNGARRGWAVGVWSPNREEWQVVDLACQAYGLVSVSLYETLGPDVAEYITNHCPLSIVFSSAHHIASLLKIAPKCPSLRVVVSMDPLTRQQHDALQQWASTLDIQLLDMVELEKWGAEDGVRCDPGPVKGVAGEHEVDRDRIVTISYTSGTTGNPKGAILTNKNLTTAAIAASYGNNPEMLGDEEWRHLSYLPLSHIYERVMQLLVIHGDGTIAFTTGDTTKLMEDAQILKPHFMPGVPRVWNRIHAAVKTQMNAGGLKGALLTKAVNTKLQNWRQTGEVKHALYDALVFRKIRNLLGGELKVMISGSAPLSPDVHEMLKICFSCDVIQGFGMTETMATGTRGIPWDINAVGTCGQIMPCNEIKVVDVKEMGYSSEDKPNPRGELCMRGLNIFPGYLHDPENTAKTIDADGWMHTGDIAEIDGQGRMKIVDRIKNVVKLSQGEYVALEKLEGIYALDPLFATLLVHADSTRSSLVALAVVDPAQAAALVTSVLGSGISATDLTALESAVQDKRVRRAVVQKLQKVGRKNKLNGFELIKGIHLRVAPFPEETMTPTFKLKRNIAAKTFKREIDQMYEEAEAGEGEKVRAKL